MFNIKILILEDDIIMNDYIKSVLNKYHNITSCYDLNTALKEVDNKDYQLIITDIMLEDGMGFELLEYLNNNDMKIPTIIITALNDEINLMKGYDLGAVDYITKPINKNVLKLKIDTLIKHIYKPQNNLRILLNNKKVEIDGEDIKLTKTEFEIFELLYQNPTRIFTKENIISTIWNDNYAMSEKIIDVNIFNIRKKLNRYSYIIQTKRGIGYYFENQKKN